MLKFKVNGYVLRGISMGETSRIITLFTLEKGKLKCVAKGVRKYAAKRGGTLEIFSRVECEIYKKENAELGMLSSVDLVDDHSAIAVEPLKFGLSSAFCEIIDKSATDNEPVPELFELAGEFFRYILDIDSKTVHFLFWAAFIKTLTLLGYQPGLFECVVCGKKNKNRAAFYDPDRGGIICSKDIPPDSKYSKLSAKSLLILQSFLTRPLADAVKLEYSEKVLYEIEKFILTFADYHTGLHRNLKSFKFLSQLKGKQQRRNCGEKEKE